MTSAIARLIDHALLHPTLTDSEMLAGCDLADRCGVASVCVKPYAVPLAAKRLKDSSIAVGTVIGFPHGGSPTAVKVAESQWCLDQGAQELDMVINLAWAQQDDWNPIQDEIAAVVAVARKVDAIVKVIFETDLITDPDRIRQLCRISENAGADFVKTSTGFGFVKQPDGNYNYQGATEAVVQLMRASCSEAVGVKASGGIRNYQQAARFRDLGCTRLGTSATEAILKGEGDDPSSY